ncbi:MAG TPA: hypothetical protein PKH24_07020 [Sedimentisphaerales bacterium]|nr:hypothetical protein [Sedimentisphaerales bacterium]HNU29430.1 hypothetical protein [Sedimentisphaerales bacterium]
MEQPVTITSLTLFITVVLSTLTLAVPRKYILLPFVIGACWVPADQCVIIVGLHFYVLQILVLAGILRLWIRSEIVSIRWNRFDRLVLAWALVGTAVYTLQWMSFGALLLRCGRLLEWLGLYWIFRQSLRSWRDIGFVHIALGVCAVAMLPFVVVEWRNGSNPFTSLGRVTTDWREGAYRCAATFPHAIMMGLFWATVVPLFIGFARQKRCAWLLWPAVASCTFMIWVTASSTPVLTFAGALAIVLVYSWRRNTPRVAWGVLFLLIGLHFVMKAPVWSLLSRVSVVAGSTGWHRYHLIDQAIGHFFEWVLIGTRSTGHWGYGLQDVTNQYILEGVRGGFVTCVLFCVLIFLSARTFLRVSLTCRDRSESYLAWCAFATVIAHAISFLGVSYFGQITLIWYLLLAAAGLLYEKSLENIPPTKRVAVSAKPRREGYGGASQPREEAWSLT